MPNESRKNLYRNTSNSKKRDSKKTRSNSLKSNIPLSQRLKNYEAETKKPFENTRHLSGYQENVPIRDRIKTIKDKLAIEPTQIKRYSRNKEKPLRVATPTRAKELVERHFKNRKLKRNVLSEHANQSKPTRLFHGPTAKFYQNDDK